MLLGKCCEPCYGKFQSDANQRPTSFLKCNDISSPGAKTHKKQEILNSPNLCHKFRDRLLTWNVREIPMQYPLAKTMPPSQRGPFGHPHRALGGDLLWCAACSHELEAWEKRFMRSFTPNLRVDAYINGLPASPSWKLGSCSKCLPKRVI